MKRNSLSYWIFMALLIVLLASCSPEKFSDENKLSAEDTKATANVIYGSDGRLDLYQVTDDRLKRLADSTVALMKNSDLTSSGNNVNIRGQNFGTSVNLCSDEKFREQDIAGFCSGSLIAPDIVLTAGHCITNVTDCQSTSLVFGFAVKSQSVLPKSVSTSDVYRCKEIIKTQRIDSGADFALIRLDRAVTGHAALTLRQQGEVNINDSLVVIGHPVGLPTKITTGGSLRSITNPDFFVANLDTYGGNSGSAVFNAVTGEIEGVLVRGEVDFINRGSCRISNICAEGACRGEDVTRVSALRQYLPNEVSQPPPVTEPITPVQPPVAQPERFIANVEQSIPDNNKNGLTSSLQVSSAPKGRKVYVGINIKHTYIGDLIVKIFAPDGKSATLHQRAGGATDDLNKSYEVTSSLGLVASGGIYKLVVQDLAARDVGSLVNWSIEFK